MEALTYSKLLVPPPHSLQCINQTVLHACRCWPTEERNVGAVPLQLASVPTWPCHPIEEMSAVMAHSRLLTDLPLPYQRIALFCPKPHTDFGFFLVMVVACGTFAFPLLLWGKIFCVRFWVLILHLAPLRRKLSH